MPLHHWLPHCFVFFVFFFVLPLSLQLIWPVVVAGLREWIDPRLVNKAIIRSRLSLCLCTDSTLDGVNAGGRRGARERRTLMVRFNILMCVSWICLNQFQWWETLTLFFWFIFTHINADVFYFQAHTCSYIDIITDVHISRVNKIFLLRPTSPLAQMYLQEQLVIFKTRKGSENYQILQPQLTLPLSQ